MTSDVVSEIAARLPRGVAVREFAAADLPSMVALQNRYSRPVERRTVADAERWEALADPAEVRVRLALEAGGELIGIAGIGDGGKWAPPDRAWGAWLRLDDAWKRRGIGTSVAGVLERFALEHRAPSITAAIQGNETDGLAFAAKRGYEEYHRRQSSYLDLAAFDPARFDDPNTIAARNGYRLASYEELASSSDEQELRRRIHALHSETWSDVPSPDIPPPPSYEDLMSFVFDSPTFEPRATTFALNGDELVGLTLADVNGSNIGYTWMTGVSQGARGHGLALAMKLRAIAVLKARGVPQFGTTNDEENVPMLTVNRKLGYVPEPPSIRVRRSLA